LLLLIIRELTLLIALRFPLPLVVMPLGLLALALVAAAPAAA